MNITLNNNKIKILLLFLIMALPGCCIVICDIKLRLSLILTLSFIIFYSIFAFKSFYINLISVLKNKFSIYFLLWLGWCIISGFLNFIRGQINFFDFLNYFLFHGVLLAFIPYYLAFDIIKNNPKLTIIRYYYIFITIIFILGIIDLIFLNSGINFLEQFFNNYLVNSRIIDGASAELFASWKRAKSTFVEPSYFADFICINLPLIYEFANTKYKIFKSNIIDILLKPSLVFVSWLLLILTKSPIFLIFGILVTFVYFILKIRPKTLVKLMLVLLLTLFLLVIIFSNINFNNTYLGRIVKTIQSLGDFYMFIYVEPSLATRVVNIINQFLVFLHHPVIGVGYGNIVEPLHQQLLYSPVPLPDIVKNDANGANSFIFWTLLAETGGVGIILLYNFFFKIILKIKNLNKFITGPEKFFMKGLLIALCYFLLETFYQGEFGGYIAALLGLCAGYKSVNFEKNFSKNLNKEVYDKTI